MIKKYIQQDKDFFENSDLEVLYQIFKLKNLYRQGWLKRDIPEKIGESVSDHTFGTAMTAWILAKKINAELNLEKVLKMALLHEVGEIYAGDITPVDGVSPKQKFERELDSANRVFNSYPEGEDFIELWKEFEEGRTPEALFVKQIDKFEMGLQAAIYQGHGYPKMDEFLESANNVITQNELKDLFKEVLNKGETE